VRISLINLNLVAEDAIGACIINQARFFQRRGEEVQIYVLHAPANVPSDVEALTSVVSLSDLIGGRPGHFCRSDLYIFHYPSRHDRMESIRGIDRGTVIFYDHNVTPPDLWGSESERDLLLRGVEGKALVHYADLCITDSPFNKTDLVERVGYDADRIHVLPLAVPLGEYAPGVRDPDLVQRYQLQGQQVLLFVGRMAGNKRIDLLIEALAQVQREARNTKLLLVGDDRGAQAFRDVVSAARGRANELGVADDVIWTGRVDDLVSYYQLADVYVTASLHEGFGVPLIEAMACGVPVVASRSGAMPWVLDEAGLSVEPGRADDLADKVLKVLGDADLRQALVERGLVRSQAFGLEEYEKGLGDIVDKATTYTLPRAPWQPGDDALEHQTPPPTAVSHSVTLLNILADEIAGQGDIALRDYEVRSRAPVVGPLIVWIRRNLTSHLREPYLDPTIENQVDLNHRVAQWMRRAATILADSAQQQVELEKRLESLEAQLKALQHRLDEEQAHEERVQ
jgi:glycosyltransferase involved in cell wall biosynthesis